MKRTIESKCLVPFIEGCKRPPWGITIWTLGPRRKRRQDDPKGRKPAIKSERRPLQLPRTPWSLPTPSPSPVPQKYCPPLSVYIDLSPPQELDSVRKSSVLHSDGQLGDYFRSWPITGHSLCVIFGPPACLILSRGLFRLQWLPSLRN